jgi:hypothetical protein
MQKITAFLKRQPLSGIGILLSLWAVTALLNHYLKVWTGNFFDTPKWFPISVFYGPTFNRGGVPYIIIFVLLLFFVLRRCASMRLPGVCLSGLLLVLLGNLGQGGFDEAFLKPFYETDYQYYHETMKIADGGEWLSRFNENQKHLLCHSRVHPPFAVLLHWVLLKTFDDHLALLAGAFIVAVCAGLPLFWLSCRQLGLPATKGNALTLLFATLPAVNIYGAVCLDGVILTFSLLYFYGVLLLFSDANSKKAGTVLCACGVLLVNLLTFLGVFLLALSFALALYDYFQRKSFLLLKVAVVCLGLLGGVALLLYFCFDYNHLRAFATASFLENPEGFRGFANPLGYLMTRVEVVGELILFLSLGVAAALFRRERRRQIAVEWRKNPATAITLMGLAILLSMFGAGALYTGESARVCLFIYPYLLLLLAKADIEEQQDLIVLAGFQTAGMQLFGCYFW